MKKPHHFLNSPSVLGNSSATKASGDKIIVKITNACRAPRRNTVTVAVTTMKTRPDIRVPKTKKPTVPARTAASLF